MAKTYGSFPGVQVTTAGGGITTVDIGEEEKLVIFGQANYDATDDSVSGDDATLSATAGVPEQINGRNEADAKFGSGSELALGMKKALANGANIEYLYGVAPAQVTVTGEAFSGAAASTGVLTNAPIVEDKSLITFDKSLAVDFKYDSPPTAPTRDDRVAINPLTGEYAVTTGTISGTTTATTIDYKYLNWTQAFSEFSVRNVVNEDETGVYVALSEAESVANELQSEVNSLRTNYKLVTGLSGAEPNANEAVDTNGDGTADRYDARIDASTYSDAIDADDYFLLGPVRQKDTPDTILGGVGGLFASNPISDPIYNDAVTGYEELEQELTKTQAEDLVNSQVIPVRQAGSIRVSDNLSTSTETDWERDFWRRRITDRVILVGKTVGDAIIGSINDEQTRSAARRQIEAQMRELVADRLIKPNGDETNWFVEVYQSSTDPDQVNIDLAFTPYGVVKRVKETITINTR